MTRNRATAKKAGTEMETAVTLHFKKWVDERIERRAKSGAKDRGDISQFYIGGERIVVEVKNTARIEITPHLREAEVERGNDDAMAGVVIAKRIGIGITSDEKVGQALVYMTFDDFIAIVTGRRPTYEEEPPSDV